MSKRFTDSLKWKKNKWFRNLSPTNKLFWQFLCDDCDVIGLWEEDMESVAFHIGEKIDKQKALESFGDRIKIISEKKWWLLDFCVFQYGNMLMKFKSKPIMRYIELLKNNGLWDMYKERVMKGYGKGSETPEEEEEDIRTKKKKDVITSTSVITTPYIIKNDLQRFICAYKISKGFKYDDRAWDKAYFSRFSKPARIMLDYFHGSVDKCVDCLDSLSKEFNKQGLTWTLDTIQKHAADWALKIENNIKAKAEGK